MEGRALRRRGEREAGCGRRASQERCGFARSTAFRLTPQEALEHELKQSHSPPWGKRARFMYPHFNQLLTDGCPGKCWWVLSGWECITSQIGLLLFSWGKSSDTGVNSAPLAVNIRPAGEENVSRQRKKERRGEERREEERKGKKKRREGKGREGKKKRKKIH